MVLNEKQTHDEQILSVARGMMAAARTAPKAKGIDNLVITAVVGEDDLHKLAERMRAMHEVNGHKFFLRDAINVEESDAAVMIGTAIGIFNLDCGMCGFPTCAEKSRYPKVPCAFNMIDMGIALGSAVGFAADNRIDSRTMYSAGAAAQELDWMPGCHATIAILLSCRGKNPFFDRTSHKADAEEKH